MPSIQEVRTGAGWHARIKGDNGETVWATEVYDDPREIRNAVAVLVDLVDDTGAETVDSWMERIDERTDAHD